MRRLVTTGKKLSDTDFASRYWLHNSVRGEIWKHHEKKCCYCERKIEAKHESDIDHFRPKGAVTGVNRRNSGYWWLAYAWDNLFFSCKVCNQKFKKNEFPLVGGSRASYGRRSLARESPFLIHPIKERPENLIDYKWDAKGSVPLAWPIGRDRKGRGTATIRIAGLDRELLNEMRGDLVLTLDALVEQMRIARKTRSKQQKTIGKQITIETSRKKAFAAFRRAYFRAANLGEYVAND